MKKTKGSRRVVGDVGKKKWWMENGTAVHLESPLDFTFRLLPAARGVVGLRVLLLSANPNSRSAKNNLMVLPRAWSKIANPIQMCCERTVR